MLQSNQADEFLKLLSSYGSFVESIDSVCDMGSGFGEDLEWWATLALLDDDDNEIPLNIKCTGVDLHSDKTSLLAQRIDNIVYEKRDFEKPSTGKYDVIWSNNSFQYSVNPVETLKVWREQLTEGGMIAMTVPSTTYTNGNKIFIKQDPQVYHHFTTVNLIHMFAINGLEIAFMQQHLNDPWIRLVAYKTKHEPMDPQTTTWYDLMGKQLLPHAAEECVHNYGYLRQDQLTLPWLDKSLRWFGND
jgi:SAM-dependent methyltransferase